ncbi:MAG: TRAP transporter large permease [Pigmentiphaga sp.]|nr:TRAP transporter large permease [Pigmentiphaga sp.]
MSPEIVGVFGIVVMLLLLVIRCPIALAMPAVGLGGFAYLIGWEQALALLETAPTDILSNFSFSAIPLFIFMGVLASKARMAGELFDMARTIFGAWRGGMAMAAVMASGVFSAISGSSLATAATISKVALPEMEKKGYAQSLAAGVLAAGGTLGVIIPPSIALLLYGLITEQSIGALFIAALIPGLLGLAGYALTVWLIVTFKPQLAGEPSPKTTFWEKLRSLRSVGAFLIVFIVVLGGLYGGFFTPTEAAAVGTFITLLIALARKVTLHEIVGAVGESLAMSVVIFFMLMGAEIFGYFISVSRISFYITDLISAAGFTPLMVLLCILALYIVLGCFMDAMAMMLLTVPVVFPAVIAAGFDPIWFGVITVITVELGLITPPVGMNVFVLKASARHLPLGTIFRGVVPFVAADVVRLAILVAFPWLMIGIIS